MNRNGTATAPPVRGRWLATWGSVLLSVLLVSAVLFLAWYSTAGPIGEESGSNGNAVTDENQYGALAQQAKIPLDLATTAAAGVVPGNIRRVDMAKQGNTVIYLITVEPKAGSNPIQVTVDATTGRVVKSGPAPANPGAVGP